MIDVAVAVGSPAFVRTSRVRRHRSRRRSRRRSLRKFAEYAAAKNIVVTLENDDPETKTPFSSRRIIDAVNHPYLRTLPDSPIPYSKAITISTIAP